MAQFTRILNVPAGAAGIAILGSVLSRRYIVTESATLANGTANNPQGLLVTDQTPLNAGQPAGPQLSVPIGGAFMVPPESDTTVHEFSGQILSNGPGTLIGVGTTAALPLCTVISATGTATAVVVTEIV